MPSTGCLAFCARYPELLRFFSFDLSLFSQAHLLLGEHTLPSGHLSRKTQTRPGIMLLAALVLAPHANICQEYPDFVPFLAFLPARSNLAILSDSVYSSISGTKVTTTQQEPPLNPSLPLVPLAHFINSNHGAVAINAQLNSRPRTTLRAMSPTPCTSASPNAVPSFSNQMQIAPIRTIQNMPKILETALDEVIPLHHST